MKFCLAFALVFFGSTLSNAVAEPDDSQLQGDLVAAFESTVGAPDAPLFFTGGAREPDPTRNSHTVGNTEIVFQTSNGITPFRGSFEVVSLPGADEFAIVSKKEMPSMAAYDNGQDTYQSVVFCGEPISGGQLINDLSQLANGKNLLKYIARAKDIVKESNDAGESVYTFTLSNRMLRKATSGGGNMGVLVGQVKTITATVTINNDHVHSMEFVVTRAHPFASANGGAGGDIQFAPIQGEEIDIDKLTNAQFKDPVVAYRLSPIDAPSKRTLQKIEQLRSVANVH